MFFIKVLPFMKEVERIWIKPVITPELFNTIKDEIKKNAVSEENEEILKRIQYAETMLTVSLAMDRLSLEFMPDSIYSIIKMNSSQKSDTELKVRREVSTQLKNDGLARLTNLQDYLTKLETVASGEDYEVTVEDLETNKATNKFFRV
jgi:hypothetical protein